MRKIFFIFFLLVSALFSNEQLEKVSLALEWKYQFQFAGYIAAKEKGFYKEAGFDVELLEFQGKETIDMLLESKSTFSITKSKAILAKMRGKEIVLVANFFKKSALVFIAQEGIRSPEDFINKKIMAAKHHVIDSNLAILLHKFHLSENDFTLVPQSYNTTAFRNKEVDITTALLSNELYELDKLNYKYNIIDPVNYGIYTYDENLITSSKYANEHPNRVRAFRDASIKGWKYALEHKEELVDIIYNKYSKAKSKEALLYEAHKTHKLMMPEVFDIGSINEEIVNNIANTFIEMKLNNKYYTLDGFIFDKKKKIITKQSQELNLNNKEQKYLKNKQIKMCIDPDWMPFESFKDGKYIGISSEYFQLIESILDKKITVIKTSSWQESLELGKQRKCDIFSLVADTQGRREFLNFTEPYFSFPLVVATLNDKKFIDKFSSITDRKLSIVKGYAFEEILKKQYPNINFVEVTNTDEGLSLVYEEKVYGHIDVLHSTAYYIEKKYYTSLKINGKFDIKLDLAIGVRNDDLTLLSILSKASSLVSESDKQKILNNWLSIKNERSFDYDLFYTILTLLAILILFLLFRYFILSKNNKKLKILQDELNKLNDSLQLKVNEGIQESLKKDKYLQEQAKLAAMGEMVGAIAHQWRQPLNSLNINIQNLDDDYDDGIIDKEFIDNFIAKQTQTIKFMSKTIDDFRNFFRVDKIKNEFSVLEAVKGTINIQSAAFKSHAIEITVDGDDFVAYGFMSEFQQVLLNLISNAKDALIENNIPHGKINICKFHKHSSTSFTFSLPLISQTAFHSFHFSPSTF